MRFFLHIAVVLSLSITAALGSGTGTMSVIGGFVGGNGTISGTVNVAAAGSLQPGAPVGTLNIDGALNVSAMADGGSGKLAFGLVAPAGSNDRIAAAGTLTIGTGKLGFGDFAFTNLGGVNIGTYILITSSSISGSLDAANVRGTINGLNGTITISGNNITLVVTEATPPTLASSAIVDDKSGGPVTVNALVTYTVTFNEDMDSSTVTADDFGNAGGATVAIGTVTETSPGVFTVQATPTTAGTLILQVNQNAVLKDVAGNSLVTTSAIADDTTITVDGTAPTLAGTNIVDNKSGGPVDINTLVTYTVTFSEDMDASSVAAVDFGNAGTATVTIGAVTETSPGVFTVQATPTTAGTLILRINATAVLKDVAGNSLDTGSAIPDDTTITVRTPYETWLVDNGKANTPENLKEYAFGTTNTGAIIVNSPTSITFGQAPAMKIVGSAISALYGRRQNYQASGLTYKVMFSANLVNWYYSTDTVNLKYVGAPDLNNPAVVASDSGMDAVSIPFPLFIKTVNGYEKTNTFMMIEVTTP